MSKLIEMILIFGVTPLLIAFGWIYLFGEVWVKGKIVLGDILKFFGGTGRIVRKLSVKVNMRGQ